MPKLFLITVCVLLCGTFAAAQKAELFAGYTFTHVDTNDSGVDKSWPAGFDIDGTYYFAHNLGLTGDFGYVKKSFPDGTNAHLISFNGGPRFKARSGKLEPFAHALLGITHGSVEPGGVGTTFTDNAFSMKLGGGLDLAVGSHFAVRVGEFNYYYTKFGINSDFGGNFGNDHQNNFTFSAGIVIR